MARGLFELRKDSVTGWWVATVVDREFNRRRFHRPAKRVFETDASATDGGANDSANCANCAAASGDGVRVRMLKSDAFIVAGTDREAREAAPDGRPPELGLVGDSGSWQTIIAPPGHHEP